MRLSKMNVELPLQDWLRPKDKKMWSEWAHPDYVAIKFDSRAPGYDYDKIFDGDYSADAWGVPEKRGIVPRGESLHGLSGDYVVINVAYVDEIDTRWVKTVRRCPSSSDFG